ncbi:MAG: glycoside hydrolase family 1 protein [Jatrophihabitans sp.]|uniref:glycoside hydrolase family 1 protein n=1 Tax=Jatrophihabitans sp. TaxID=1932789 RepID=UPI003F802ADF
MIFPDGFTWGAATAAYQIEGAVDEDGRGPSIWDTFSAEPGRTLNGDTGAVACDHYHRVDDDVALMAELGLQAYRFSVAWPRVVPTGSGAVNQRGVDFYSRLVDRLLERGIAPVATLYHWDLPQPLQDEGGWTNRDTAARFAEYASVMGQALGDRVGVFTTLNEPWCSAYLGYAVGLHAPGVRSNPAAYRAVHHLNLAHGLGTTALRAVIPSGAEVALTLNTAAVRPATPDDVDAARHVEGISNRVFLDPVLRGGYPADIVEDLKHVTDFGFVQDGDLAAINVPVDRIGVNYYSPTLVAHSTPEQRAADQSVVSDPQASSGPSMYPGTHLAVSLPQPGPHTAMGWRIEPGAFTELLTGLHRGYPGTRWMVTENGAAFDDEVSADGAVHDADRVDYLRGHLAAVHDAISAGVDISAYFVWSLMDNFEWALGYSKRFGVVRVDYDTQRRTPKDSALFYRDVIAANGLATG